MNQDDQMRNILHKKHEHQQQNQLSQFVRRISGSTPNRLDESAKLHDRLPDEQNRRNDIENLRK